MNLPVIIVFSLLQGLLASHGGGGGHEAYFEFIDANQDRFVIRLIERRKIAHARAILRGEEVEGNSVMGKVVKQPADYNPQWSYHLRPKSIEFFDFAIEVCDASISYLEDHLDEAGGAFLPGRRWCPWSSRLTREVTEEVLRERRRVWREKFKGKLRPELER